MPEIISRKRNCACHLQGASTDVLEELLLNWRLNSERVHRQLQIKSTAGERGFIMPQTCQPNFTTMCPRHAAYNSQPQTGPAALESCFTRRVNGNTACLIKLFKNQFMMLRVQPNASISHCDLHAGSLVID